MPTAPLDSLELAMQTARVRVNDAIASINGDILQDIQPFTLTFINAAWRRFQELLVNYGVTWFKPEQIFSAVAAVTNADPASQQWISWTNFFDGTTLQPAPVLPQNFISPLILWERATGPNNFLPMDKIDNGLPAVPKLFRNYSWEWRNGAIYIPGATAILDLRMRYAASYPDFVASTNTPFASQPIPIVRAQNPLAWFIAAEFARSRGDLDAGYFDQQAQMSTKQVYDLDPMQAKSIANEAQYGAMTDRYTPTEGPAGPRGPQGVAA